MRTKIVIAIVFVAVLSIGIFFISSSDNNDQAIQTTESAEDSAKVLGASTTDQSNEKKNILKKVSVQEAKDLIAQSQPNDSLKIIDIRTNEEFMAGNIEGSVNIDFYGNFEEEIGNLDKNGKYLIYCRSGNRSSQAISVFEKLGFNEVYNLEGGYSAWTAQ